MPLVCQLKRVKGNEAIPMEIICTFRNFEVRMLFISKDNGLDEFKKK